jgi:TfoX/Sxy family transcriptional regulator of competence genes
MAVNEAIAMRVREQLNYFSEEFIEKKMFGGISFLYKGKMTIGILKDELAVRVIASKMDDELSKAHVRPMDFTKRPMKEFIYVTLEGFKSEEHLLHYIHLGLEHAKSKL